MKTKLTLQKLNNQKDFSKNDNWGSESELEAMRDGGGTALDRHQVHVHGRQK